MAVTATAAWAANDLASLLGGCGGGCAGL